MENGPFIDVFPMNTSIYKGFSMAMLNNQMVYIYIYHTRSIWVRGSPMKKVPIDAPMTLNHRQSDSCPWSNDLDEGTPMTSETSCNGYIKQII